MNDAETLLARAPACYQDRTEYARANGYTGHRKVVVSDGKVYSHGNKDWFEWIAGQREKRKVTSG